MREHIESVRAFLLASLRDSIAVEDLVQETFFTAWKILDRYDRQLSFGPWIRGIASKLLMNYRRKIGRDRLHYCDEDLLNRIDDGIASVQKLPGSTFDEKVEALRACLDHLTGPQRDSIRLHYENGLHCKPISRRPARAVPPAPQGKRVGKRDVCEDTAYLKMSNHIFGGRSREEAIEEELANHNWGA